MSLPPLLRRTIAETARREGAAAEVEQQRKDLARNHFFESTRYVAQVTKRANAAAREHVELKRYEDRAMRNRRLMSLYDREWKEWTAELAKRGLEVSDSNGLTRLR
eukprot:TRINITY_DN58576_c0_g1_i1.p2 TRINITY_DN58576_c0_g1~~TRINITY_DN58576_c0_g1_i1.p2  ORF type:complete len:106 (-),score=6.31 TRINITY_DN58576_c0_g1_i1:130-447(-)